MESWIEFLVQTGALGLCVLLVINNERERRRMADLLDKKDDQVMQISKEAIVVIKELNGLLRGRPCLLDSDKIGARI